MVLVEMCSFNGGAVDSPVAGPMSWYLCSLKSLLHQAGRPSMIPGEAVDTLEPWVSPLGKAIFWNFDAILY